VELKQSTAIKTKAMFENNSRLRGSKLGVKSAFRRATHYLNKKLFSNIFDADFNSLNDINNLINQNLNV
jgi:hypothetical protein